MIKRLYTLTTLAVCAFIQISFAQQSLNPDTNEAQQKAEDEYVYQLSMGEAMELAQLNSIASMQYRNMFTASYWNFRAYKASRLPALRVSSNLGNFNHSLVPLQNTITGEINYRSNFNMSNQLQLSLDQVIAATGGQVSLYTSIERLDQFGNNSSVSYYSQPISLSYLQPIFSFNPYKWNKKIEPKSYERAKREYLESMENVTLTAVNLYWQYASSQHNYDIALNNFNQSKELYATSQEKFRLGTITKTALLQLELKVLNDSLAMNNNNISLISTRNVLSSFIGLKQSTNIDVEIEFDLPRLELKYIEVLEHSLKNSSFEIDQQIKMIESQRAIAQAKGDRGFSMQLDARFGLSNNSDAFQGVYRDLRDQEVVGLTISLPIYDWGLGKGKVQMAKAQSETTKNQLEQSMIDYEQDIFVKVMQFNNQMGQCQISSKAAEIADESYKLAMQNFLSGSMTVTDLNAARTEYDNAQRSYVTTVGDYWKYYYEIRKLTLHDYILGTNINAEFDKIVEYEK